VSSLIYATGCFNALLNARTRPAYLLLIPVGAVPLWLLHRMMLGRMRKDRLAATEESRFARAKPGGTAQRFERQAAPRVVGRPAPPQVADAYIGQAARTVLVPPMHG